MLEIKFEGQDEITKSIDAMAEKVKATHKQMPQELVEWQTDDMRRRYPNIQVDETPESVEATTEIWPRSRLEQEPGFVRPKRPYVAKGPTQYRLKGAGRKPASTRPILRQPLFAKLVDRMNKLLEGLTWQ
jgi:hypothetical protein